MLALSPVPEICVSPAPPAEPLVEPFSPFSATGPTTPDDSDSFRPSLLSPPPTVSPRFPRQLSPLRPNDVPVSGKGLERERFEEMLRASRERNAALGGKRSPDLRKEIAIKVHKNKQVERRALFLSKIQAPPSPSAINLPKTPPESPAIFHYSLPSPGLQSPLAVFEAMVTEDPTRPTRESWVEQVEFHVPEQKHILPSRPTSLRRSKVPSLEQIQAHYGSPAEALPQHQEAKVQSAHTARLPAFLKLTQRSPAQERSAPTPTTTNSVVQPERAHTTIGRLQLPIRGVKPEGPVIKIQAPAARPPPSPLSPVAKLRITTMVVPRTSSRSPTEFTELNLLTFNSTRVDTAQTMLTRLRRRTMPPGTAKMSQAEREDAEGQKKIRRRSAPPEIPFRERRGFSKPPLNLPGAF